MAQSHQDFNYKFQFNKIHYNRDRKKSIINWIQFIVTVEKIFLKIKFFKIWI